MYAYRIRTNGDIVLSRDGTPCGLLLTDATAAQARHIIDRFGASELLQPALEGMWTIAARDAGPMPVDS